jgi:hypothetical protein
MEPCNQRRYYEPDSSLGAGIMKLRKIAVVAAWLLLACLALVSLAYSHQYAKFITVQDIEKVTGLKGVNPVPKTADADGDLNFAGQDGKLLLSVSFLPASAYTGAKSSKSGFKTAVAGIGEEAFIGPAGKSPAFILVFRKAAYTVVLNSELENETRSRMPIEHLTALAKIIASRM